MAEETHPITKRLIEEKFIESGLKPSSAKNYSVALVCIVNKLGHSTDVLKGSTDKWFSKQKFDEKFDHLKKTTVRNYISAIVSWMKVKDEVDSKLYKALSVDRDEYNHYYERIIKTGEKTEYEKAMWVEPELIKEAFEEKVMPFLQRMNFDNVRKPIPNYDKFDIDEIKKVRDFVILSLYMYPFYDKESDFGVIRNDIATLYLSNGKDMNTENNYFVMGRGGFYLRMVDYKTQSSHGVLNIPLPPLIGVILKRWCIFSRKNIGDKLFINLDKHHVTEILQRGMKNLVGKSVGVQMLRKIYVSWRFGKQLNDEKKVADSMMHTLSTQQNVYIKN